MISHYFPKEKKLINVSFTCLIKVGKEEVSSTKVYKHQRTKKISDTGSLNNDPFLRVMLDSGWVLEKNPKTIVWRVFFDLETKFVWTLNQQAQLESATLTRKAMGRVLMILFKGYSCFCFGYNNKYAKVSKQNHATCQMNMLNSNSLNKIEIKNTGLGLWIDANVYTNTM